MPEAIKKSTQKILPDSESLFVQADMTSCVRSSSQKSDATTTKKQSPVPVETKVASKPVFKSDPNAVLIEKLVKNFQKSQKSQKKQKNVPHQITQQPIYWSPEKNTCQRVNVRGIEYDLAPVVYLDNNESSSNKQEFNNERIPSPVSPAMAQNNQPIVNQVASRPLYRPCLPASLPIQPIQPIQQIQQIQPIQPALACLPRPAIQPPCTRVHHVPVPIPVPIPIPVEVPKWYYYNFSGFGEIPTNICSGGGGWDNNDCCGSGSVKVGKLRNSRNKKPKVYVGSPILANSPCNFNGC